MNFIKYFIEKIKSLFHWGYRNSWSNFNDICDDDDSGEYKDWF